MPEKNVYEYINISNVINQLHLKKTCKKGNYIYAICPFCQNSNEKNGYLKANVINNLFVCRNCEKSGSSVDLYAKAKFLTTKEAFKILLKELPILDNMPYIYNNPVKDEYYRDLVYRNFLKMQKLSDAHYAILKEMNFKDEYIKEHLFTSVEINPNKKKNICKNLQEQGFKLDGIPGMYQDIDFKWTYKSHKGIFIPVTLNNKIQGLRILLDSKYNLDTENIWFSSNNEYNGTKASNWPLILKDADTNWIDMYNSNNSTSIIIATEMILAHKLFNNTNKTVIGIPNNIDKEVILNIVDRMNASKVFLYVDKHTILHTSTFLYENIIETLEKNGIEVDFRVTLTDKNIGYDLNKKEKDKKVA